MLSSAFAAVLAAPLLVAAAPARRQQEQQVGRTINVDGDFFDKCLAVASPLSDGAKVYTGSCLETRVSDANGQHADQFVHWELARGSGVVKVSGTNYCLDAGENPHNNGELKVWTCYDGLPQQRWYLTDDDRIAIDGGDQCLDDGPSGAQTYQCTTGNSNQLWMVNGLYHGGLSWGVSAGPAASTPVAVSSAVASASSWSAVAPVAMSSAIAPVAMSSAIAPVAMSSAIAPVAMSSAIAPVAMSSAIAPVGTSTGIVPVATSSNVAASQATSAGGPSPSSTPGGTRLHPNGDSSLCLTVSGGSVAQGSTVWINTCFGAGEPASYSKNQLWDVSRGDGEVRLHDTPFCLDFGSTPSSGTGAKIWDCLDVSQQRIYYTDDNRLALTGGDQCLDVVAESVPTQTKPYGSLKDVQSWQCAPDNIQQIWTTD